MNRSFWAACGLGVICAVATGGAPFQAMAQAPVTARPAAIAAPVTSPASGARLSPGEAMAPAELEAFVDGVVRQAMADQHIAGATVAIVQHGQVALKKGYGFANLAPYRPADPDRTLFRIGSISKTFTWILLMKEVEAGHMRLDGPINLYLPETLRIPDEGFKQPIRVADLMNHTPGFEDRALGQLFERDPARIRPLNVYLREERPRRVREPGTLVAYSNYGAALAGAAVSEVTGKTFEDLVELEITRPLGLARTTFREPRPARRGLPAPLGSALGGDMATGYRWTPSGFHPRGFEYIGQAAPAGAASSTGGDMARYMLMLLANGTLDGVQIYGPVTAAAFTTPLPRPAPGVPASRHGLFEQALPGGFLGVGHNGATLSFHSNIVLIPQLNLGVFVAANSDRGGALTEVLPGRLVGRFYATAPVAPAAGSAALTRDAAAFEGVYLTDRRAYHGLEGMVDRLIGAATVKVTRDGRLTISDFDGVTRFAPDGVPGQGRFVAEDGVRRLVFWMRGGRARGFFAPSGGAAFERLAPWRHTATLAAVTLTAFLASLWTMRNLFARARREFRESSTQRRAGLVLTTQSALWIAAMALFAVWAAGTGDVAKVMYGWPSLTLLIASTCALVAGLLSLLSILLLPLVWRGGRRVDSWTGGRKFAFTLTTVVFAGYSLLLASWGALEPWTR